MTLLASCWIRRIAAGLLGVCLAGAFGAPARAELKYCNHSSFYILSAVAYVENREWRSRGWIPLRPGECQVVMKDDMSTKQVFTYAEGHEGHRGEIRTWEGRIRFCTGKDRFDVTGREDCRERGYEVRHFARLDKSDNAKDWTMEFRELRSYTLERALIAGVQRLLFDVGYNAGQIDGYMGRRTALSIRAFQSRAGMKVDGRPSFDMIDELLERATAIQTQSGYWLCNKTEYELWAAVGFSRGKSWTSRGWWKVPEGQCIKPVKDRLDSRFFYTYAETERENGERVVWGGDHPLCTADVMFEIKGNENCAARGYDKTGFQRQDTEGRNGWRQDFVLPDGAQ
ncbi:MAG: DUF1036 domain-containing protein [Alphaproteobacteria bacterium]